MAILVKSLGELVAETQNEFGDYQNRVVQEVFDALVDGTPFETGNLRANWKVAPGSQERSGYDEYGDSAPMPEKPNMKKYKRNWTNFSVYNNTPYIEKVNNGEGGNEHNANFIQMALSQVYI